MPVSTKKGIELAPGPYTNIVQGCVRHGRPSGDYGGLDARLVRTCFIRIGAVMNPKGRDHASRRLLSGFTTTPNTLRERVINSGAVWAVLMAIWAACDFLIAHHPSGGREMPPEGGTALRMIKKLETS